MGHDITLSPGLITQIYTQDVIAVRDIVAPLLDENVMQVGHAIKPIGSVEAFIGAYAGIWGCDMALTSKRMHYLCGIFDVDSKQSMVRLSQEQCWIIQWIAVMVTQPSYVVMFQTVYLPEVILDKLSMIMTSIRKYRIGWLLVGAQDWVKIDHSYQFGVLNYDAAH